MPIQFSIQHVLKLGWDSFRAHPLALILFSAFAFVSTLSWSLIPVFVQQSLLLGGIFLVIVLIKILVRIAIFHSALEIVSHKAPTWRSIVLSWKSFFPFLLASIISIVLVFVGMILLIIPGILLAVMVSLFPFVLLDRRVGPIDALKESIHLTNGNRAKLLFLLLVLGAINIGGLLLFVVGIFFTMPFSFVVYAHTYRILSGSTGEGLPIFKGQPAPPTATFPAVPPSAPKSSTPPAPDNNAKPPTVDVLGSGGMTRPDANI